MRRVTVVAGIVVLAVCALAQPGAACTNGSRASGADVATVPHPTNPDAYAYLGAQPATGRVYAGWNTPNPGHHYEVARSSDGTVYAEASNTEAGVHVGSDRQCTKL